MCTLPKRLAPVLAALALAACSGPPEDLARWRPTPAQAQAAHTECLRDVATYTQRYQRIMRAAWTEAAELEAAQLVVLAQQRQAECVALAALTPRP